MKKYIFIISILALFVSCKKKSTIHITAKNIITGEPYAGLKYSILVQKAGYYESNYKVIESGELDENGKAFINRRFLKNNFHDLSIEYPTGTCYSKNDHFYFSGGENVKANFEFAECGYLKHNVLNVNCEGAEDYIIIYLNNQLHSLGDTPWELKGCEGHTGSHYSSIPVGYYYYKWQVTRNGNTQTYYDTIYLNAGEYKTYNLEY